MEFRRLRVGPLIVGALVLALALLVCPRVVDSAGAGKSGTAPTAERLVLRYANGSFELISRTPLHKVVPPSVSLPDSVGKVRGNWFEVQSDAGKTVYRRRMAAPDIVYTEIPTEDDPAHFSRAEVVVPERTISILVPVKDDSNVLVLYGPPAGKSMRTQAAGEIGRIRLH